MTDLAHEKLTLRRHNQLMFCVVEGHWFDLFCFVLGTAGQFKSLEMTDLGHQKLTSRSRSRLAFWSKEISLFVLFCVGCVWSVREFGDGGFGI